MLPENLTEQFCVRDTECDLNKRMMPGALLRLAQQIATDHCLQMGMDDAFYQRTQAVFLLAKMGLEWKRIPCAGEPLTLITRPQQPEHAIYKRVTQVLDGSGQEIGLIDSRWILADIHKHRILRHAPEEYQKLPFEAKVDRALPIEFPKPEKTELVGTVQASYTYCDVNGHMNNSRYADIACDALPPEELRSRAVQAMCINYRSELPFGQSCTVRRCRLGPDLWYVVGIREDDRRCFEATLRLAEQN